MPFCGTRKKICVTYRVSPYLTHSPSRTRAVRFPITAHDDAANGDRARLGVRPVSPGIGTGENAGVVAVQVGCRYVGKRKSWADAVLTPDPHSAGPERQLTTAA